MNRVFLLLMLAGFYLPAAAQQNKTITASYFNQAEMGIGFGIGNFETNILNGIQYKVKNTVVPVSLQDINGFYLNKVGIGIGIGAEYWGNGWFFPLFGRLSYDFRQEDNTFYLAGNLGTSFGSRDSTVNYNKGTGALTGGVSIGYKMKIAKRLQFLYEVYYQYQALQSSYNLYVADTLRSVEDYKVPLNFLGLRIGIIFR
jgi:hypothetical protein